MTRRAILFGWAILFAVILSAAVVRAEGAGKADLRVMSFNILLSQDEDHHDWKTRKANLAAAIKTADPDLFGVQEALPIQMDYLAAQFPDYGFIGVGRDDGKRGGEHSAVFYKKSEFELLDSGTFWLSETPDVPGKKGWDASCNRVVSWGKFRQIASDRVFIYANTHFDHLGKTARIESAKLVLAFRAKTPELPFIISGDFNSKPESDPYKTLAASLQDAHLVAKTHSGEEGRTYRGKEGEGKSYIDYIFFSGDLTVESFRVDSDPPADGIWPSDHFPIYADLKWGE